MIRFMPVAAMAAALLVQPAGAQFSGLGGELGNLGSGLGGGLLPNLSSQSAGNAAGLLGYCVKNKLLGGSGLAGAVTGHNAAAASGGNGGVASVLGALTGKSGVTRSPGYARGQAGELIAGRQSLPLDGLKGKLKGKVCDMVLQHARSFL